MRKIIPEQVQIGEIDITEINIELDNRDEIPQLLRGLQYIYSNESLCNNVFKPLNNIVPDNINVNTKRNGMSLRVFWYWEH